MYSEQFPCRGLPLSFRGPCGVGTDSPEEVGTLGLALLVLLLLELGARVPLPLCHRCLHLAWLPLVPTALQPGESLLHVLSLSICPSTALTFRDLPQHPARPPYGGRNIGLSCG